MPTEEEIRQALEDMLYERPAYETDAPEYSGSSPNMQGGFSDLPNVGQKSLVDILREAEAQGEQEPIKSYRGPGETRRTMPPENYMGAYKYGKGPDEPEYKIGKEYITPDRDKFMSGGERVPLSLFKPPDGRSYLDYDRGGIIYPELGPGTVIREPRMYNQGTDAVMKFLREQLRNLGY
jgi:hypothetical protein